MYHVTEDERAHKLMYKSFELSLSRPTDSQIAKTILSNEDCNKVQSENNLSFLGRVRDVVVMFLQRNELEYRQHNNLEDNPQCECDYDCECYLNKFIMPAFKNLALKFEPYIKDDSLVNHILEEYTVEEKERLLSCNLREVLRLMLYKGLAYLAFEHGLYDVSCWHHEAAVLMYGGSIVGESLSPSEYVEESEILSRNYRKIGAKGGSQKGINYSEPQQKALNYHDKYLSDKNERGKFICSNDKAAREIIAHFEGKSDGLGYAERSLSNILSTHRKKHFKD
ncbi:MULTISPECIES: hypothetical protein [unclassified Psychrobacter]|uniref:hypothetical protein n=1 Tax=unclassified Psychrobacter TaxID=196806 RepID=UPI001917DE35|nr:MULTISPECIES: hypothetical protein [unclassified Psychrobacter]|tara:strand:+ start:11441 stop:12283 length:843 start_codon:yes stop_codon:yes gene_type:complete